MGSCLSADSRNPSPDTRIRRRRSLPPTDRLRGFPGRMIANGGSEIACMFTQQGKKGTNQDAMIVWENFSSRPGSVFCGVFDGHGPCGHIVARRVRDSLPLKLASLWDVKSAMAGEEAFPLAFKEMDRELRMRAYIDCFCSGTTAVTLVKKEEEIVIGNIGDSRAVLGTRDEDDALLAVQLTVDLKPNLPEEAERIKKCRGRVFSLQEEPEVARVWLPNHDSPGLAMARAFGDFCLKDFGLISVPDVSFRRLDEKDEFIVLATDGVWDVLTNKEVVDVIAAAPLRSSAAQSVVESAIRAWRWKYPTSKIDDCAVVCLFLSTDKTEEEDDLSEPIRNCNEPEILAESESDDADMIDEDWSALEGVARVNTLLNLPRFMPQKYDKIVK